MKDTAKAAPAGDIRAWRHLAELAGAARRMRFSPGCEPQNCLSAVHDRYGSKSHVVSASLRTKHRTGWSFTGLTRTLQWHLRAAWYAVQNPVADSSEPFAVAAMTVEPVGCSSADRAAIVGKRVPPPVWAQSTDGYDS